VFAPIVELFSFVKFWFTADAQEWNNVWRCKKRFKVSFYNSWWVLYGSRK